MLGKPLGIAGFSFLAVKTKIASLPANAGFKKVIGIGFLGGIGFTMSIFISILAFKEIEIQTFSKIAVLTGSMLSGLLGYILIYMGINKKQVDVATEELTE
ncbi:Na(+)/H(+) antiporter NhaA [compost metagenome]